MVTTSWTYSTLMLCSGVLSVANGKTDFVTLGVERILPAPSSLPSRFDTPGIVDMYALPHAGSFRPVAAAPSAHRSLKSRSPWPAKPWVLGSSGALPGVPLGVAPCEAPSCFGLRRLVGATSERHLAAKSWRKKAGIIITIHFKVRFITGACKRPLQGALASAPS